ncbi:MAG: hypothetical protein OHK0046_07660 [Anaerolineae bacterium]
MFRRIILAFVIAGLIPALSILGQGEGDLTIHVVQRGENLFRIALSYGLNTEEVAAANGITNPANIQVGQRLIIPVGGVPLEEDSTPQQHTVQAGESLFSIAQLYNTTTDALVQANGLANPNAIYVGQVLQVGEATTPTLGDAVPPPANNTIPVDISEASVIHVIQGGETLFRIATQYGTTVAALQQANGIPDPTVIFAGQEIVIPGVEPPQIALDLPALVTGVDVTPNFLSEGRSGRLRLTTQAAAVVTGTFLDQSLVVIPDGTSTTHTILISVPIYTNGGVYPVNLNIAPLDGTAPAVINLNLQILSGGYGSQSITLPADRVELLSLPVEENELGIIQSVTRIFNAERYFSGPMSLPAAAVMNSPFGTRRAYNGGPVDRYHTGADFAGAPGTPIFAAAAGRVVLADTLNIRGISVIIDHGWGVYTNYSHMTERYVQLGDFVETGQTIGTVGNTGRATGAHLHWEVWVNGIPVDPMQWVRQAFF